MLKTFDVVVRVQHSTMVSIQAHNEEEAIQLAKEQYYDGKVMEDIRDSEYCDGLIEVTAESQG